MTSSSSHVNNYLAIFIIVECLFTVSLGNFCSRPATSLLDYGAKCQYDSQCVTKYCEKSHCICAHQHDFDSCSLSCVPKCGSTFSSPSTGRITGPNYPYTTAPYSCSWTIAALSSSSYVLFSLTDLDLRSTNDCSQDVIEIRDGGNSLLLFRSCNTNDTRTLTFASQTSTMKITVKMSSTGYRSFTGVYRIFNQSSSITATSGYIASPGFPVQYRSSVKFSWTIAGKFVTLNIMSIHLEPSYDKVIIYNGTSSSAPSLGSYTYVDTINTSGNGMHVIFQSDGSNEYSGFSAMFYLRELEHGERCDLAIPGMCKAPDLSCRYDRAGETRCLCDDVAYHRSGKCIGELEHGERCDLAIPGMCKAPDLSCRYDRTGETRCLCDDVAYHRSGKCIGGVTFNFNVGADTISITKDVHVINYCLIWFTPGDTIYSYVKNITLTNFTITNLTPGQNYTFEASFLSVSDSYYESRTATFIQSVVTLPATPGRIIEDDRNLKHDPYFIKFQPSRGKVQYYNITFISEDSQLTFEVIAPELNVTNLTTSTEYNYTITAYNVIGNCSAAITGSFKTGSGKTFNFSVGTDIVSITKDDHVINYSLIWFTPGDTIYSYVKNITLTNFTITNLTPGQNYTFEASFLSVSDSYYESKTVTFIQSVVTLPATPGRIIEDDRNLKHDPYFIKFQPSRGKVQYYNITFISEDSQLTFEVIAPELNVTNLTTSTEYNYTITAYNVIGNCSAAITGSFKTGSGKTFNFSVGTDIVSITKDDHVINYSLIWFTPGDTIYSYVKNITLTNFTITNLTPGQNYTFEASFLSVSDSYYESKTVTFIQSVVTLPATPGRIIEDDRNLKHDPYFIKFQPSRGKVQYYNITFISEDSQLTFEVIAPELNVTNLTTSTEYNYTITAYNVIGNCSAAITGSFKTGSGKTFNFSVGTDIVSITKDDHVINYSLIWFTPGDTIYSYVKNITLTNFTITNLTPGQNYTFEASFLSVSDSYYESKTVTFIQSVVTLPATPGRIIEDESNLKHDKYFIKFQPSRGKVQYYNITFISEDSQLTFEVITPELNVTNLTTSTEYNYTITAYNAIGNGSAAITGSFKTGSEGDSLDTMTLMIAGSVIAALLVLGILATVVAQCRKQRSATTRTPVGLNSLEMNTNKKETEGHDSARPYVVLPRASTSEKREVVSQSKPDDELCQKADMSASVNIQEDDTGDKCDLYENPEDSINNHEINQP